MSYLEKHNIGYSYQANFDSQITSEVYALRECSRIALIGIIKAATSQAGIEESGAMSGHLKGNPDVYEHFAYCQDRETAESVGESITTALDLYIAYTGFVSALRLNNVPLPKFKTNLDDLLEDKKSV